MRLQLCLHVAFPAPTVFCVLFVIEGQLAGAWFWRAIYCLIVLNRDVTLSLSLSLSLISRVRVFACLWVGDALGRDPRGRERI